MANPILNAQRIEEASRSHAGSTTMTVGGTVGKTLIASLVLLAALGYTWHNVDPQAGTAFGRPLAWSMWGGLGIGFISFLLAMFVPALLIPCTFIYAVAEGVFLGALTMMINQAYPGLPLVAAGATATTVVGVLLLYSARILRPTPGFVKMVIGATIGLILFHIAGFALGMFGVGTGVHDAVYGSGTIGILFSVFVVGLAAMHLVIDFGFIEQGSRQGAPKRYEWLGALGLMVTLVWMYISMLQLLMKLRE